MDPREQLLALIATHSFKLGDFTLASGQKSDYYIDCRITTLHAEAAASPASSSTTSSASRSPTRKK